MSRIRSKGTKLEKAMRQILEEMNIRYLSHPRLEGNPDFLLQGRIALFCDSSFWHGRRWKALKKRLERGSRPEYWVAHIARNRARDRQVTRQLSGEGYLVLRFWDDEVFGDPRRCRRELVEALGRTE
ncbi:MAG: DUF559 domain-containing protein [archaeon]|nr:MAG: DUF559 domain-containing protein [archaeon]